VETQALPA